MPFPIPANSTPSLILILISGRHFVVTNLLYCLKGKNKASLSLLFIHTDSKSYWLFFQDLKGLKDISGYLVHIIVNTRTRETPRIASYRLNLNIKHSQ